MGVHRRLEEAGAGTAFRLGAVEREIGAAHQVVARDAVIGRDRNADADAERRAGARDHERFADRMR